ncbi:MAG: transcription-repair coupling factor [Verrucomicrobiota bacterium]
MFAKTLETPAVQSLARRLEAGGVVSLNGICAGAQPFLAVCLHRAFPRRPLICVTPGLKAQEIFHQDIETWLEQVRSAKDEEQTQPRSASHPASRPLFYPEWEMLPHESRLPHVDVISERLETLIALSALSIGDPPVFRDTAGKGQPSVLVVTTVTALLQRTFCPADLRSHTRTLQAGDKLDPLDLTEWLEEQGYEPEAQVTQKGEFAWRGGILDVFPLTEPWPVRLEFFGDELESLRDFDPLTQISREQIARVTLPPGGELGILKGRRQKAQAADAAEAGLATLFDYLPQEAIFILCEPGLLSEHADEYARQVPVGDPFLISWEAFQGHLRQRRMTVCCLAETEPEIASMGSPNPPSGISNPQFQSLDAHRPLTDRAPERQVADAQRREFLHQLHRWLRQDYAVHVFCNNEGERKRFQEIWREHGLEDPASEVQSPKSKVQGPRSRVRDPESEAPGAEPEVGASLRAPGAGLWTHLGSLARGFICDEARAIVVTDAEIFGRYKVQRPRRLKSVHAQTARSALDIDFTDFEEGDLVVHVQHGVGRYLGLKTLPTRTASSTGRSEECLVIEFASGEPSQPPPKLYVPVTEAHLVGKYVGAGKARPPLNTLGGTRWIRAKEQAERAVRDIAAELLSIQAARESQPGHPFAPDTPWQGEFESAFIFEETPDQARAIQETKSDMERPKPMDRLICGDVGFGKTEVAIRAAFKAVMGGRQVAVLVPTTVLAQQHFNTFRERMADYPIRVELLSRFRTRREQERVVRDLVAGSVDIVIGTHRLLQADIAFKELGLVVIDEEQRFGVMHKEKFKTLRKLVDVLTLSATPIPRTLYLALTGARDMSTIQSPPHDRLPVETLVVPYDERIIRDAIQRELNRGGQAFFLHNRVTTIHAVGQKLGILLPHARIVVGHGQMHSDELEEVMTRFVNGEADVLLSTTIIESGLDIPNANTIIIDRADRFGLSDLYQLRGRVGRYKHQAYAYLLLPRHAGLLADVRRRLGAIKQFSTLGSGFKIAMRDLEIRGAGNLLGAEQSGHITAVGFELYCQLLKQSVATSKGEKVKLRVDVSVRLDFLETSSSLETGGGDGEGRGAQQAGDPPGPGPSRLSVPALACLPHDYVPAPQHRIEIYRKLAQSEDKAALENLARELRDRFGPLQAPVELLLQLAEMKVLASGRGVSAIEVKEDRLMLTRHGDFITLGGKFPRLAKKQAGARLKEIKKLLLAL